MNRAHAAAEKNINNVTAADKKRSQGDFMKKLYLIAVCIFAVILCSCDLLFGTGDETDPTKGNFWAVNAKTSSVYRVDAELLAEGEYCNVWVEKGTVNAERAQQVADEYDNNIYQKMIDNFSLIIKEDEESYNIMDIADLLCDEDEKLCILLLNIKDWYNGTSNLSYVAGYFWPHNFSNSKYSNKRDMIYIDTYPGMYIPEKWTCRLCGKEENNDRLCSKCGELVPTISEAFCTLAHEMQHLMNYTTTLWSRQITKTNKDGEEEITGFNYMDLWIDEGLAAAAEWVYSGKYSQDRIAWFNNNGAFEKNKAGELVRTMTGKIDKGNNFFVWENYDDEKQYYAIMDDYATVSIFFQWLRLQGNNLNIYRDIITSDYWDYKAVVKAMTTYYYDSNNTAMKNSWNTLFEAWLAANYINDTTGVYGYMGEPFLSTIRVPPSAVTNTNPVVSLAPGEAVYSAASTQPSTSGNGTNIRNAYIKNNTLLNSFSAGCTVMTINTNTSIVGVVENGRTTGVPIQPAATSITASFDSAGRSVVRSISEPYRVDARGLLNKRQFDAEQFKGFKLKIGKKSDE